MEYSNPMLAIKVLSDLQERLYNNKKKKKRKYKKNGSERNIKK